MGPAIPSRMAVSEAGAPRMSRKQRRAQGKSDRSASSDAVPPDAAALHEAGVEAYRAGDPDTAAALIGQAIAVSSVIPNFHYNLGIVLKAAGRLEEAAASYQRALALKPDYAEAHNNLGNVWKALGRREDARASFTRALQLQPGNADTHYNLGVLASELGSPDLAVTHFRDCLAADPDDRWGARLLLAHLGAGDAPQRTSQAQLLSLYEVRARFWDQEKSYFGAALVADGLRRHIGAARLDILDIGCGTGLVGAQVRDLANRLDGADISPAMLEKADAKGAYDHLFRADLAPFMTQRANGYDAVLAAATLIHFGDLTPLFQAVSRTLRGCGLFVFTLFPLENAVADYAVAASAQLAQSGCFRHSAGYVKRLAAATGFAVLALENAIHEHDENGNPVPGLLVVLRRG